MINFVRPALPSAVGVKEVHGCKALSYLLIFKCINLAGPHDTGLNPASLGG